MICEERPAGEADPRMKANLLFGNLLFGSVPRLDTGTIYYLKTSQPHIHDFTISGPYHPIGTIRRQMLHKLAKTSFTAFEYFHEAFEDDVEGEGVIGLSNWGHLIGPLDDSPRHTIKVELLKEHNPALAAELPGPCYRIIFTEHKQWPKTRTEQFAHVFGYVPVEDIEVHGTFLNRDKAEAAARKTLKEKLKGFPGYETVAGWRNDDFTCAIVKRGSSGQLDIQATIQARYDDGHVEHV